MLESLIAYHCAPALAGIKPANIVACRRSGNEDVNAELDELNMQLNGKDIYIEKLCSCESRVLVMVYRRSLLEKHLQSRVNKAFLKNYGYTETESLREYIDLLKSRLAFDSFPHEIGVFLGYPLRDIHCFIKHRGKGCLLCGEWKVYHNAEKAEKMFKRFKSCRKALAKRVAGGLSLAQIFCAA